MYRYRVWIIHTLVLTPYYGYLYSLLLFCLEILEHPKHRYFNRRQHPSRRLCHRGRPKACESVPRIQSNVLVALPVLTGRALCRLL